MPSIYFGKDFMFVLFRCCKLLSKELQIVFKTLLLFPPETQLGLGSPTTDSAAAAHAAAASAHWGSAYNSSYATYLGQNPAAAFNSSSAAALVSSYATGGATTPTAGTGSDQIESTNPANQIPTGRQNYC